MRSRTAAAYPTNSKPRSGSAAVTVMIKVSGCPHSPFWHELIPLFSSPQCPLSCLSFTWPPSLSLLCHVHLLHLPRPLFCLPPNPVHKLFHQPPPPLLFPHPAPKCRRLLTNLSRLLLRFPRSRPCPVAQHLYPAHRHLRHRCRLL